MNFYERGITMQFDFKKFQAIAKHAYPQSSQFNFDECMSVFKSFFERYEEYIGVPHPPIKASQIQRFCLDMPYIFDNLGRTTDLEPADYPAMIDDYFATMRTTRVNANINHFFSGRIREIAFYRAGL